METSPETTAPVPTAPSEPSTAVPRVHPTVQYVLHWLTETAILVAVWTAFERKEISVVWAGIATGVIGGWLPMSALAAFARTGGLPTVRPPQLPPGPTTVLLSAVLRSLQWLSTNSSHAGHVGAALLAMLGLWTVPGCAAPAAVPVALMPLAGARDGVSIPLVLALLVAGCTAPWHVQARASIHAAAIGHRTWDHAAALELERQGTAADTASYPNVARRFTLERDVIHADADLLRQAETTVDDVRDGRTDRCTGLGRLRAFIASIVENVERFRADGFVRPPEALTSGLSALGALLRPLSADCGGH